MEGSGHPPDATTAAATPSGHHHHRLRTTDGGGGGGGAESSAGDLRKQWDDRVDDYVDAYHSPSHHRRHYGLPHVTFFLSKRARHKYSAPPVAEDAPEWPAAHAPAPPLATASRAAAAAAAWAGGAAAMAGRRGAETLSRAVTLRRLTLAAARKWRGGVGEAHNLRSAAGRLDRAVRNLVPSHAVAVKRLSASSRGRAASHTHTYLTGSSNPCSRAFAPPCILPAQLLRARQAMYSADSPVDVQIAESVMANQATLVARFFVFFSLQARCCSPAVAPARAFSSLRRDESAAGSHRHVRAV